MLTMQSFITQNTQPETVTYTDNNTAYSGLTNREVVNHSAEEFVRRMIHANVIESFWSMFKISHTGTFHIMSHKQLERYVFEFTECHNILDQDAIGQVGIIIAQNMSQNN